MLHIPCPFCGPRDEREFSYGGEAHIARPENSWTLSDADWADYVFMRTNPKGRHAERWRHSHGCGRWFNALRDTVTHEIAATYRIGEAPPAGRSAGRPARKR
jgi:heterotetrameric sarcosine oxidase delta subunit